MYQKVMTMNDIQKASRLYLGICIVFILHIFIATQTGFSLRGFWADFLSGYCWLLATLLLFIFFRKVKWVRIYTWVLGGLALVFAVLLNIYLLPALGLLFGLNFQFSKDLADNYSIQVRSLMDGPHIDVFRTYGPFEEWIGTVRPDENNGVGELKNATSVVIEMQDGNVVATFQLPDKTVKCFPAE